MTVEIARINRKADVAAMEPVRVGRDDDAPAEPEPEVPDVPQWSPSE